MITALFELHPVFRHETYPVTIFHISFYLPGWVCAVLQKGYTSVAGFSSRITRVTILSVHFGFVLERMTLGHHHPPPLPPVIPFSLLSIIPYQMSIYVYPTYHTNYTMLCLHNVFSYPRLSLFVSLWGVIEHLSSVEGSSVA